MTDTDDVALLELAYVLRLYRFYVCAFVENAFAFSYGSVLRCHRMSPAICHRYGRHTERYTLHNNNNIAASRKEEKFANIGSRYLFAAIAVETLGPFNTSACQLFGNLGRKISASSGDDREGAFLFWRVSVLVPRFNAVLLHDSLPTPDCTD